MQAYLDSRARATSDANGHFRLELPSAARVGLDIEKTQFVPRSVFYTVKADEVLNVGKLFLIRSGTIRGRVVTAQGEPLEGFTVTGFRVLRQGDRQEVVDAARTKTDDRGEFRLTDLQATEYWIQVKDPLPTFTFQERANGASAEPRFAAFYPGVREMNNAQPIPIDGNEVDLKDLVLLPAHRPGSVRVHLKKLPNAPDTIGFYIQHLTVSEGYNFGGGGFWYSGAGGRAPTILEFPQDMTRTYSLQSPGIYEIRWVAPVARGAVFAAKRFEFTGEDMDVDFAIGPRPNVNVNLTVVTEDLEDLGEDIGKIRPALCLVETVSCVPVPVDVNPLGRPVSPNRWQITLGPIPTGVYRTSFSTSSGYLPQDVYDASVKQGDRDALRDGIIVEGRTTPIEILFKRGVSSMLGQVVDTQNNPVHDARVTLAEDSPASAPASLYYQKRTRTDQHGTFEFQRIRPGNYILYSGPDSNRNVIKVQITERQRQTVKIVLD
jgi:hypothetical protein